MDWILKTQMCQFANENKRQEFNRFVLANVDSFDEQAWDMFISSVNLIPEEIKEDKEFHRIISEKLKAIQQFNKVGLSSAMRIEYYLLICKDIYEDETSSPS